MSKGASLKCDKHLKINNYRNKPAFSISSITMVHRHENITMLRKKRSPTHPSARKVSCKNLGKSLKSLKFNSLRSCTFVFIEVAGFNVDGIFIEDTQFLTPQTLFFSSEHIVGDASNNLISYVE